MRDIDLAILGCGNMGFAIARGALAAGVLRPERTLGVDPSTEARRRLDALGVQTSGDPGSARDAARILLAVKPQSFDALARMLAPVADASQVISVMGGWSRERIGASLRMKHGAGRVTRAMPNLAVTIGKGVTAIVRGAESDAFADALFRSVGEIVSVHEALLDAVTAVSGSGPAYAFLLAESMLEAAKQLGFDDETATRLVVGTLDGAVGLLQQDERGPAELRAAVTSRGGTTEAATRVWMERNIPAGIVEALRAAAARAAELGRGA